MSATLALHARVLRDVLRRMFSSRLGGLLNILVIGIAISLPAGLYVLMQNAQGLLAQFSGAPQISLFLETSTGAEQIEVLRQRLTAHPGVAAFEFVPRERALEQLKQNTGLSDVIGELEKNPLPDAFIVSPHERGANALDALRDELAALPGIELAQLDSAWAHKLEALLRFGRLATLILASLLSLALVAVTFNTIRLQILTQREEIEVSRLIGATDGFIRRPFLYFGALQGLLGGLVAWLIVALTLLSLNQPLADLSRLYESSFTLQPPDTADSLSLLLFSLYLGWLGAWLSVNRHLSLTAPR